MTYFSVVVPVFNRAHVIERTIESVLAQSFGDFEVVIVDDASTDNLREVLSKFSDTRIKYVRHEENRFGGAARNTGVAQSVGDYIAFLDSDDVWDQRKLEVMKDAIESFDGQSRAVYYHRLYFCDRPNLEFSRILPKQGIGSTPVGEYLFAEDGMIQTSCMVIAREVLVECPFDEALRKHQDWDLCIKLENYGCKFVYVDKALTYWDQTGPNRVSLASLAYSLAWIKGVKEFLTPRGYEAFRYRILAPMRIRSGELALPVLDLVAALLGRKVSLRFFTYAVTEGPVLRDFKSFIKGKFGGVQ